MAKFVHQFMSKAWDAHWSSLVAIGSWGPNEEITNPRIIRERRDRCVSKPNFFLHETVTLDSTKIIDVPLFHYKRVRR